MFGKNICGSKLELQLFPEIFAAERQQDSTNESQGKINPDARSRYLSTKKETSPSACFTANVCCMRASTIKQR
jgi:hypothetical protein